MLLSVKSLSTWNIMKVTWRRALPGLKVKLSAWVASWLHVVQSSNLPANSMWMLYCIPTNDYVSASWFLVDGEGTCFTLNRPLCVLVYEQHHLCSTLHWPLCVFVYEQHHLWRHFQSDAFEEEACHLFCVGNQILVPEGDEETSGTIPLILAHRAPHVVR